MSRLKESDFYYGAVLSTLLNNDICPALIEGDGDRQVYDFTTDHKDFRLFVKYRSAPININYPDYHSWQFTFSPGDIEELKSYMELDKELSLGLVCGNKTLGQSHFAILHKQELEQIFAQGKNSLTISLKKGEHSFRISVGGGRSNALKVKTNRLY